MEDELPEEFRSLRQQYKGLTYPGDLAGDLGIVPLRTVRNGRNGGLRMAWTAVRWIGLTAAAAAVAALVAGGVWRAVVPSQSTVASVSASQPAHVEVAVAPPANTSPVVKTPAVVSKAPETAVASATPKGSTSTTTDDSIPLWSEIDVNSADASTSTSTTSNNTYSTVAAGLPSQSLIMPTWSELQAESSKAQQGSAQPSKS